MISISSIPYDERAHDPVSMRRSPSEHRRAREQYLNVHLSDDMHYCSLEANVQQEFLLLFLC